MLMKVIFVLPALALGAMFLYFGIRTTQKKAYWETVGPKVVDGYLQSTKTEHNALRMKDWGNKGAERKGTLTRFQYSYCVDGKEYTLAYDVVGSNKKIPTRVEIHCNPKFPEDAYIPDMTPKPSMSGGKGMLYMGLLCLVAAGWIIMM